MKKKSILNIIMVIVMLFSSMAIPSLDTAAIPNLPVDDLLSVTQSTSAESLTKNCSILNYVDEQLFLSNGYAKRIEDEESLNSYIFEREDGTRSLYFFGEDVKFVSEDKKIVERDISLCETADGYTTKQNNVGLFLGSDFSKGVSVSFDNHTLLLLPTKPGKDTKAIKEDNSIVYPSLFGDNSDLVFTPILTGVKQDIVLKKFEGINSFDFIISSDSLKPFFDGRELYFATAKESEIRFNVGEVYVYDASGRFITGEISYCPAGENRWLISLNVPVEFLTSDETVYPVVIDPYFRVNSSDYSTYIADTTIYSGKPSVATGTWQYNHTGYVDGGYDIGRMLVSIPGLTSNSTYNKLLYTQITSAVFCIRDSSGTAAQQVDLYKYTGAAWTENTATWNNTSPNGNYTLVDTQNPSAATFAEYDITSLVWDWKLNPSDISLGFMLKSLNESDQSKNKAFDSSESITATRRPYVKIDYIPQIFLENSISINEGESYTLNAVLLPPGATISWQTNNPAVATVDNTGVVTAVKANAYPATIAATVNIDGQDYCATCSVYVKIPDGSYYLKNKSSGNYADASGYYDNDEVLCWSFHGASNQKWCIEYLSNGQYSIKNSLSNKYLGVESLNSTTAITRQYSSLNNATKWFISRSSSGAYKLYAKGNLSNGYVIGADSSNNTIVNMEYTNDLEYSDEWLFVSFGNQPFRELAPSQYTQINCHGYAMMRNDKPDSWLPLTDTYINSIQPTFNGEYSSLVKNGFSLSLKEDFENWLTDNNYSFVYEADFIENGDYKVLDSNQYRVVIRGGLTTNFYYWGGTQFAYVFYDYHLWYQMSNGQWANKHGFLSVSEPQRLDVGVIPSSTHSLGWTLDSYNSDTNELVNRIWDFYDCTIYSYIITVSN